MSVNKAIIIGRLGQDPEKRVTQGGKSVATLSVATTENYKDQQGNRQEKTEWHRVVLWDKLADLAEQYLKKGSQVYIEGSLKTEEWTDKDGNKRQTTKIAAQTMQFLDSQSSNGQANNHSNNNGSRSNQQNSNQHNQTNQNYQHKSQIDYDFIEDDSIPF